MIGTLALAFMALFGLGTLAFVGWLFYIGYLDGRRTDQLMWLEHDREWAERDRVAREWAEQDRHGEFPGLSK